MTIESRPDFFTALLCGRCGRPFVGNVAKVVCFLGQPFCLKCVTDVNETRARLGGATWGIPPNAYAPEVN